MLLKLVHPSSPLHLHRFKPFHTKTTFAWCYLTTNIRILHRDVYIDCAQKLNNDGESDLLGLHIVHNCLFSLESRCCPLFELGYPSIVSLANPLSSEAGGLSLDNLITNPPISSLQTNSQVGWLSAGWREYSNECILHFHLHHRRTVGKQGSNWRLFK